MNRQRLNGISPESFLLFLAFVPGLFWGGLWAVAGIGSGLWAFVAFWRRDKKIPWPSQTVGFLVPCFLLAACLASWQSPMPDAAWDMTRRLASILIPLSFLSCPAMMERLGARPLPVFWAFVLGGMSCLLALEIYAGTPLDLWLHPFRPKAPGYNRGFSYAVLAAWPLAALVWQQKGWKAALLFALLFLPLGLVTLSRATQMAVVLGLGTLLVAWVAPRVTYYLLILLTFLSSFWAFGARQVFLEAPGWVAQLPGSWLHRVEIWDSLSYAIQAHPIAGWGPGVTRFLPPDPHHAASYVALLIPAPHPHNFLTQFWVELGLPGLVIGLLFALWVLRQAFHQPPALRPFALAAFATGFAIGLCAYDAWSDSLLSMIALILLLFGWVRRQAFAAPMAA